MAYYDVLIAKWSSVTGADTAAKIANLNALTVAGPAQKAILLPSAILNAVVFADMSALTQLQVTQLTLLLQGSSVDASSGTSIRLGIQTLFAGKTQTLTNLGALVAPFDSPQIPWWQANGYSRPFHKGDIVVAGLDTTTGYSAVIGAPVSNKFNVSVTVTVTGPNSTETDTTFASTLDVNYSKMFAANAVQNMMVRDGSLATFGG